MRWPCRKRLRLPHRFFHKRHHFFRGFLHAVFRPAEQQAEQTARAVGHEVLLVSASSYFYLKHLKEVLGVTDIICTRLDVDENGVFAGRVCGENCRGVQKPLRLAEYLAAKGDRLDYESSWAYGDSSGDLPMVCDARAVVVEVLYPRVQRDDHVVQRVYGQAGGGGKPAQIIRKAGLVALQGVIRPEGGQHLHGKVRVGGDALMALTLTDEAYSVLCSLKTVPEGCDRHKVQFYVLLLCHLLWVASCTAGAALGGILNGNMTPKGNAYFPFAPTVRAARASTRRKYSARQ